MKKERLFIISHINDSKDKSIYPSVIEGQKHNYLLTEEDSEYIHIVSKDLGYYPSQTLTLSNINFNSNLITTRNNPKASLHSDRIINLSATNDKYNQSSLNVYLEKAKNKKKQKYSKQSLWYYDYWNKRRYDTKIRLIDKAKKCINSTLEKEKDKDKDNCINSITNNNSNTSDQSRKSKVKLKNRTQQSFIIENGLPAIDHKKKESGSKLNLRKQSITKDKTYNEHIITSKVMSQRGNLLFNNTNVNYNKDSHKKKEINDDSESLNDYRKENNTFCNGMNKSKIINNIKQETLRITKYHSDNIPIDLKTKKEEDDIDNSVTPLNNNTAAIIQVIKSESGILNPKENNIKVGDIEESNKFVSYILKMKFLTKFYNQREGIIRKAADRIKHSSFNKYTSSIRRAKAITTKNKGTKRRSIFLIKDILTHHLILSNSNKDSQDAEIELIENELILSLNQETIISVKCNWNSHHINTTYLNIHKCILSYYPTTSTKKPALYTITLFENYIRGMTLLDNFSAESTKINYAPILNHQQEDLMMKYEKNISLKDKSYINSFIVRNIAGRKIDKSMTYLNLIKQLMPKHEQEPLETYKGCKYFSNKRLHIDSSKTLDHQITKKLFEITVETIQSSIPNLQSKHKQTFEEIDYDITNINLLKNQELFTLPFQKQRTIKLKRMKLTKALFAKGKNYRLCSKAKKEYLIMKKAGLTGVDYNFTLNKLNNASYMKNFIRCKTIRETLFDMVYSNDGENFIKQMDTLIRNEYINDRDQSGNTLLAIGAKNSNLEIVKYLLEKGSNPNIVNVSD